VWRFLYRALWVLARGLAPALARGDGKLARAARGRLGAGSVLESWAGRDPSRPLVWFHAASVGEGRQAEAVLRILRTRRPRWQIAYTFSSSSAERFAAGLGADFSWYLPPDTRRDVGAALAALRPTALVFSATDVWPELVRAARERGVRLGMISAALSPASSRRGALARAFLGEAYAGLDLVGATDEADAERLVALGVRPAAIRVTGDSRHDSAASRAAATDRSSPTLTALGRSGAWILVAGSTWPADERQLLPAVAGARRVGASLRMVIAPHEPTAEHLAELERRLSSTSPTGRTVRLSALERGEVGDDWDACIVDRIGILADLYAIAAVAYVGGGFHRAGLHAVIEPAAHGVPVLFGARWRGSRDARLLIEAGAARDARDAVELEDAIAHWWRDETARAAAGAAARAVVDRGKGAAERSADLVIELLEKNL
jgi:3-deoxy-D-manno-octulosonic-acid transferase